MEETVLQKKKLKVNYFCCGFFLEVMETYFIPKVKTA